MTAGASPVGPTLAEGAPARVPCKNSSSVAAQRSFAGNGVERASFVSATKPAAPPLEAAREHVLYRFPSPYERTAPEASVSLVGFTPD